MVRALDKLCTHSMYYCLTELCYGASSDHENGASSDHGGTPRSPGRHLVPSKDLLGVRELSVCGVPGFTIVISRANAFLDTIGRRVVENSPSVLNSSKR